MAPTAYFVERSKYRRQPLRCGQIEDSAALPTKEFTKLDERCHLLTERGDIVGGSVRITMGREAWTLRKLTEALASLSNFLLWNRNVEKLNFAGARQTCFVVKPTANRWPCPRRLQGEGLKDRGLSCVLLHDSSFPIGRLNEIAHRITHVFSPIIYSVNIHSDIVGRYLRDKQPGLDSLTPRLPKQSCK